jgi:hypothetical protein
MKRILPAIFFVLIAFTGLAQTNLKFCVEAGKDGSCKSKSSDFTISSAGGTITFMLKNEKGLGTTKVVYKIYRLGEDGTENFNNTIEQYIHENWNYAWEEAVFYDPGTYKVMVYDKSDQGELICMGILKIFTQ